MFQSQDTHSAIRKYFRSGNLTLSYLDFGGESHNVLLLLHGHMNDARTYAEFASRMKDWRVISLDQRGHGWSDHPADTDYSRESYIQDIVSLICTELGGQPVVLLGHSLGGLNAFQVASRYPEYVKAVIVEDIGVEIHGDVSFVEKLPERSSSLKELRASLERAGVRAIDYFSESVFEDERGWGFRSDLKGMPVSQKHCNGAWWEDWLSSTCPILLIHGKKSFALNLNQAEQMTSRRPNTELAVFEHCGHDIHSTDRDGFYKVAKHFLDKLN
ncbi:alpha/beta fold hydrolase [Paenibacillus allorhizosphaerae]|uniref:2-(Acetamidomethylene)succinate hydrolase n=1 Tax=Paenibacillus allorhizosphaerae TaxID=2849866 RepID=A0ABM8VE72_9BACL|nr:alpha/beta hydrolase [Paenibacillus allorhizosphaerae]CAG7630413.1 2-(acetamidomethylene)succinate hydrolase [Paenibacillus allorhizosphaerae]